jgi:hypothetical protein
VALARCGVRPAPDRQKVPGPPAGFYAKEDPDRPAVPACTSTAVWRIRKVGARGDRLCVMAKDLPVRSAVRASPVLAHLRGPPIFRDR